jgi:hypothetical protein
MKKFLVYSRGANTSGVASSTHPAPGAVTPTTGRTTTTASLGAGCGSVGGRGRVHRSARASVPSGCSRCTTAGAERRAIARSRATSTVSADAVVSV